jgi:hypothetical protein
MHRQRRACRQKHASGIFALRRTERLAQRVVQVGAGTGQIGVCGHRRHWSPSLGQVRGVGPRMALPRYDTGGAPGVNVGGSEGTGGGSSPRFDPGSFVRNGRLSAQAVELMRPISVDSTTRRIRVEFGNVRSGAETDGDLIRIDRALWIRRSPFEQMQVLVHETTHSAQFDTLGYWRTRWRLGVERITHGFEGVYDVPAQLERMKLQHRERAQHPVEERAARLRQANRRGHVARASGIRY